MTRTASRLPGRSKPGRSKPGRSKPGRSKLGRHGLLTALAVVCLPASRPLRAEVDALLQLDIDQAIEGGRIELLERLPELIGSPRADYPMGRIALPLAAAVKAGASPSHPTVEEAFRALRDLPLRKTYSVACYLFALDARWRAATREAASGSTTYVAGQKAQGALRAEIVRCVEWLVDARVRGRGHWTYSAVASGSDSHDYSNTQFAVLGLQIGVKHGVPIPREVFAEIADRFVATQREDGAPHSYRIRWGTSVEDILKRRSPSRGGRSRTTVGSSHQTETVGFSTTPGGWAYRGHDRDPYPSMTAAGASSLQVALAGLPRSDSRRRTAVNEALYKSYAWISDHFQEYMETGRHPYYTLYSLEKVGDLGNIDAFDGRDWYEEGARVLLGRRQGRGWGSYVNTSFALLFLTRATRLQPKAPTILTRAGRQGSQLSADYVYLSRLDGFVSALDMLRLIGETRRSDLVKVGEEVVRHYQPGARGNLVAPLLGLWTERRDPVTRFARSSLEEITGIRSARRDPYVAWQSDHEKVHAACEREDLTAEEVERLLDEIRAPTLRARLLDAAQRQGLRDLTGYLIGQLDGPLDAALRRKIHGLLVLWTGRRTRAPEDADSAGWELAAADWRRWWDENRQQVAESRRARDLVARLDSLTKEGAPTPGGAAAEEVGRVVAELESLGDSALPAIRSRLTAVEFSFLLLEVLERITGREVGLTRTSG